MFLDYRRVRVSGTFAALALAATLGAGSAEAQQARGAQPAAQSAAPATPGQPQRQERNDSALRQHCTTDYFKFCGNIAPDNPEVDRCFARNWKALSPNCRTAIDAYDGAGKAKAKGRG